MNKIINFIGVSYDELQNLDYCELETKIKINLALHVESIHFMGVGELKCLLEQIKETRKQQFRFSQEFTSKIEKKRIQLALSELAKLFRMVQNELKKNPTI